MPLYQSTLVFVFFLPFRLNFLPFLFCFFLFILLLSCSDQHKILLCLLTFCNHKDIATIDHELTQIDFNYLLGLTGKALLHLLKVLVGQWEGVWMSSQRCVREGGNAENSEKGGGWTIKPVTSKHLFLSFFQSRKKYNINYRPNLTKRNLT